MAALQELGYSEEDQADIPASAMLYHIHNVAPLRRLFAWGIPSHAALRAIADAAPAAGVVEVGAGTGLWAHLLHSGTTTASRTTEPSCRYGIPVAAYDAALSAESVAAA